MSKDMGIKQQTPSVIAKLMGLDELPPQQPIRKRQRVLSEDYLRKSASIGLREKRSSYGGCSSKVNNGKQPKFKDAFEVPDKVMHCIQSNSKEKASSSATKANMAFLNQKFTDAKCPEMDEKIQNYQSGQITVLKSSSDPNYRKNEKCWKLEKRTARRNALRPLQKLENDFRTDTLEDLDTEKQNLLKTRLEFKDETCHPPTRIFVLKPNSGNIKYAARSSFLTKSHLGSQLGEKKQGIPRPINEVLYDEVRDREKPVIDLEPSRHGFIISGGTAKKKELTQLEMQIISRSSTKVSRSEVRADDTSVNETEVIMPSCSSFFDSKNQNRTLYSSSNWSSYTWEAKKQLNERWKMTKKFQEVGATNRCHTLGEIPNGENTDLSSPSGISCKNGMKNNYFIKFSRFRSYPASSDATGSPKSRNQNEDFHNGECLGLEEAVTEARNRLRNQNFSEKGKSKPGDSRFSCKTSQSSSYMDLENDQSVQETQVILNDLENKLDEENQSEENYMVSELSGGDVPCSDSCYNHPVQETQLIQDELENSFKENNTFKAYEDNFTPNSSVSSIASGSMIVDVVTADMVAAIENVDVEFSSKDPKEQHPEPTACNLIAKNGHSSSNVWDASVEQESSIGSPEDGLVFSNCSKFFLEFAMSLGEAYQPSPNSVLEPPFKEEILSDSECFESVSANLHGLWMQLRLLKSEAEDTHSVGPGMIVSSDEGTREGSVDYLKENGKLMGVFRGEESRDFSYLVDVLDEAGFHVENWEIKFERWHSLECAASPSVFEALEKKYGEQTSWKKSERRLLFDRINSGLMQILQPCMNIHKWANSLKTRISNGVRRDMFEEELWKLLVNQEKEVSKGLSEKSLGGDIRWLELGDDIDIIVSEIENFLFNELAAELGSV